MYWPLLAVYGAPVFFMREATARVVEVLIAEHRQRSREAGARVSAAPATRRMALDHSQLLPNGEVLPHRTSPSLGWFATPDCLGDIARGKLCGSEILVYSELHSLLQRPVENGHGRLPAGILSGNFA